MSLRFATRTQIQKAMNAAGRAGQASGVSLLHFISNYSRGAKYGSGTVDFTFNNDGKANIIRALIDPPNSARNENRAEFIWNAELLSFGCFDGPHTTMEHC